MSYIDSTEQSVVDKIFFSIFSEMRGGSELGSFEFGGYTRNRYRIGLLIPMSGAAGIWGPSCISSAQVAVGDINNKGGIEGREVELVLIDAAAEQDSTFYYDVDELISSGRIDAIVGMHLSSVRNRLSSIVGGRIPYIYTPLHEGGVLSPYVCKIGETPENQLLPALRAMRLRHSIRRWALIGNNYEWPIESHSAAKSYIFRNGGRVVFERYLDFGFANSEDTTTRLFDDIKRSGAEGLILSLIGQDSVDFNRVFGYLGFDRYMFRLSCAIEENVLLAIGADNSKRLYVSSSYFSVLSTDENMLFKEKYHSLHGSRGPILNNLGQSLYEGICFLPLFLETRRAQINFSLSEQRHVPVCKSARRVRYDKYNRRILQCLLARADGHIFSICEAFES